jgi:hypothetical protein
MSKKVMIIDIQKNIIDFNFKKNLLVDYINHNQITKKPIDIPEMYFDEQNIDYMDEIVCIIKQKFSGLKQEIIEKSHIDNNSTNINILPNRYTKQYNSSDDIFWGIGLENECYLQAPPQYVLGKNIVCALGRERYSVDYTLNYSIEELKKVMSHVYQSTKLYPVSQMINAHSFDKMDRNGNHKTTYEKEPKPNNKFSGKTVLEEWVEFDCSIDQLINSKSKTESNIFFDGDTIEFITEKFYKTNTEEVVKELINNKNTFIDKFNKFKKEKKLWESFGEITFPTTHPGINIFNSSPKKIVFFNNTTIHAHITLPTKIKNGFVLDNNLFVETHAKAIKLLQWFEPFFICTLGSPDLLQFVYESYHKMTCGFNSTQNESYNYFARGSMRATLSRYIGIGTYDTDQMITGKLLTHQVDNLRPKNVLWWRDMISEDLLYNLPTSEIGFDFNYGKHYQSGLEFRLLDGIPMEILKDVLDVIILICEHSYSYPCIESINKCSESQTWNNLVYKSLVYGYTATITKSEMLDMLLVLNINTNFDVNFEQSEMTMEDFYYLILEHIFFIYDKKETNAIKYLAKSFVKINKWNNFNKIQSLAHIQSIS